MTKDVPPPTSSRLAASPGLFYRFRVGSDVEFICIDTSKEPAFSGIRLFEHPNHSAFLEAALTPASRETPRWRIPFCHHPPFSAGPRHKNTDRMGALPEGIYDIRIQVEETHTPQRRVAAVDQDEQEVISFDVTMDDRTVDVALEDLEANIATVLDRSSVDGATARQWLADETRRPTRQACLLNLLASLRTRPNLATPLVQLVHDVFHVANDRLYAKVDRRLLTTAQALADDPSRPFFAEGKPHAPIHGLLIEGIPDSSERPRFKNLLSFRSEGKPSMQIVVAVPPADLPHTYAEFDLDLANPLQDVVGFFVHIGELLDGKPTNHLDLRKSLAKTKAADFLYYTVVNA